MVLTDARVRFVRRHWSRPFRPRGGAVGGVRAVLRVDTLTPMRGGFWWWMHHSWRGVMCLGIGLIRVCVVMWWLVSRLRRWLGIWGAVVGR